MMASFICVHSLSLCSQFIYELTHSDAMAPTEETIRTWLKTIGEKIGIALTYTKCLSHVIVNQARCLDSKKFAGGCQRSSFMQQSWTLKLKPDEVSCSLMLEQNDSFRQLLSTLQELPETASGDLEVRIQPCIYQFINKSIQCQDHPNQFVSTPNHIKES